MAGPLPRYGTCINRVPVTTWNSSPAMLRGARPGRAVGDGPRLGLGQRDQLRTLRAGTLLLTASAMGMLVAIDTPTKAVPKS